MKYIERYNGTYDEGSREDIRDTLVRGRSTEAYCEFDMETQNVKITVDYDGLTFDVVDTTNEVGVLIGNKLMIENEDDFIDLLMDYSRDKMYSFEQDKEKLAEFIVSNLSTYDKDKMLISLFAKGFEGRNIYTKDV